MVKVTVNYEGELRCSATHIQSGATMQTDAPLDNNGRGESFSPTDLCATALGTCISTIIGMQMERLGIDLAGMKVEVTKEMSADTPRRISKLVTEIWLPCAVAEEHQQVIERAAKTCPVHFSLHPDIDKPILFHWC